LDFPGEFDVTSATEFLKKPATLSAIVVEADWREGGQSLGA